MTIRAPVDLHQRRNASSALIKAKLIGEEIGHASSPIAFNCANLVRARQSSSDVAPSDPYDVSLIMLIRLVRAHCRSGKPRNDL